MGRPMARAKKRTRAKANGEPELPFHAFWSGSLSFGLVNVPVLVFPATRHSGVRLRMISPDGVPLERRIIARETAKWSLRRDRARL